MPPPDPIAFVAGASGCVGRDLVAALVGRGARVIAHLRPDSPRAAPALEAFAGAEVSRAPWRPGPLAADLRAAAPTHVFFLADGGARHVELCRTLLDACASLDRPPRYLYVSSLGAAGAARSRNLRDRHRAEEAVRDSGMPFTIARPGVIHGSGRGERRPLEALLAHALRAWASLARALGARQHARRYRPTDARELAHGLVHAAFNYTTIDRVLQAEELRYDQANLDEHHVPASRRDGRH